MGEIERSGYIERTGGARYGFDVGGLPGFNVAGRVAERLLIGMSTSSFFASRVFIIVDIVGAGVETSIDGGGGVEVIGIIGISLGTNEGGTGGWEGTRGG